MGIEAINLDRYVGLDFQSKEYIDLLIELNEERFTAKDLKINHRIINHWTTEGLIKDHRSSPSEWRKFSFTEYVLISILSEFRTLGMPLDNLKKLVELMDAPVYGGWYKDKLGNYTRLIFKKSLLDAFEDLRKMPEAELSDELLIKKSEEESEVPIQKNEKVLILDLYVSILGWHLENNLVSKSFDNLMMDAEGEFGFFRSWNDLSSLLARYNSKSYSVVNVFEILKEFISKEKYLGLLSTFGLLNEDELEVLKYLRKGDLASLRIKFKNSGEIDLIEESKNNKKVDPESRLIEFLPEYGEITIKTHKGKIVTFNNDTKHKLN